MPHKHVRTTEFSFHTKNIPDVPGVPRPRFLTPYLEALIFFTLIPKQVFPSCFRSSIIRSFIKNKAKPNNWKKKKKRPKENTVSLREPVSPEITVCLQGEIGIIRIFQTLFSPSRTRDVSKHRSTWVRGLPWWRGTYHIPEAPQACFPPLSHSSTAGRKKTKKNE